MDVYRRRQVHRVYVEVDVMATERMSIRKYATHKNLYNIHTKDTFKKLMAAGYTSVSNIEDLDDYLGRFPKLTNINEIEKWNNEMFNNKHWMYIYHHWFFTKENDATMFKLTWL